ncbi:DUF2971 domain-containing protein [Campylobacter sp. RM16188]|uniref:DUF2971 domain-containing protein n=1 Tax=Campylobacter sp. RM16188 TaxID=1705725 RepID=UPI001556AA9D|nr:DUF2971 domain-containing protein [Campylobacter sp. RM16188]
MNKNLLDIDNLTEGIMKDNEINDINLQKYYKLRRFLSALRNDKFTFQKPSNWDDPFEDFISKLTNYSKYAYVNRLEISHGIYAMSTLNKKIESEAMWKNFANSTGVLVHTTTRKIIKSIIKYLIDNDCFKDRNLHFSGRDVERQLVNSIKINKIEYMTDEKIANYFKQATNKEQFDYGRLAFNALSIKRREYDYESEYRVFIVPKLLGLEKVKLLHIGYFKETIDKVILSPLANDVRIIRLSNILEKKYGIHNIEKSHLYDLEYFKKKFDL